MLTYRTLEVQGHLEKFVVRLVCSFLSIVLLLDPDPEKSNNCGSVLIRIRNTDKKPLGIISRFVRAHFSYLVPAQQWRSGRPIGAHSKTMNDWLNVWHYGDSMSLFSVLCGKYKILYFWLSGLLLKKEENIFNVSVILFTILSINTWWKATLTLNWYKKDKIKVWIFSNKIFSLVEQ
jgi:hypothetical protein